LLAEGGEPTKAAPKKRARELPADIADKKEALEEETCEYGANEGEDGAGEESGVGGEEEGEKGAGFASEKARALAASARQSAPSAARGNDDALAWSDDASDEPSGPWGVPLGGWADDDDGDSDGGGGVLPPVGYALPPWLTPTTHKPAPPRGGTQAGLAPSAAHEDAGPRKKKKKVKVPAEADAPCALKVAPSVEVPAAAEPGTAAGLDVGPAPSDRPLAAYAAAAAADASGHNCEGTPALEQATLGNIRVKHAGGAGGAGPQSNGPELGSAAAQGGRNGKRPRGKRGGGKHKK
jgi:hypothetical protein